jgi:hypothetical protein
LVVGPKDSRPGGSKKTALDFFGRGVTFGGSISFANRVSVRMAVNIRAVSRRICWQLKNITAPLWPSKPVLPVLASERVHDEKSTSARRLAFSLSNQDF